MARRRIGPDVCAPFCNEVHGNKFRNRMWVSCFLAAVAWTACSNGNNNQGDGTNITPSGDPTSQIDNIPDGGTDERDAGTLSQADGGGTNADGGTIPAGTPTVG